MTVGAGLAEGWGETDGTQLGCKEVVGTAVIVGHEDEIEPDPSVGTCTDVGADTLVG